MMIPIEDKIGPEVTSDDVVNGLAVKFIIF